MLYRDTKRSEELASHSLVRIEHKLGEGKGEDSENRLELHRQESKRRKNDMAKMSNGKATRPV